LTALWVSAFPPAQRPVTGADAHNPPPAAAAPRADHHTHIWSATAAALLSVQPLPAVKLPDDLDRFLREKERRAKEGTVAAVKDLYTEDALVLDPTRSCWLRGPAALKYVAVNATGNKLVPNGYDLGDAAGYVTGTQVSGEGASLRHVSTFHYALKKGAGGKWRIAVETFTDKGPPVPEAVTAERLVAELDAAGIGRAAVLSVAYWFDSPLRDPPLEDAYAKVRAENDWVAGQAARYPGRLAAFFSFNPLKDYAPEEIERCAKDRRFKGIKLHFGNSGVDARKARHAESLRRVFRAANERRLPIVVHLWVPGGYGREHSEAFLKNVLPAAPDVPVQIAHLAASGPGYHSDNALEVFAEAAAAGDPRMANVYFDVAGMVLRDTPPKTLALVARRLRQLGMRRVLFGSDRAGTFNVPPGDAWAAFRRLPLTDEEFRTVAGNLAPYLR
jgi:predicted TIM-barrel fold metal-dependent hydrolase/ketosteroid isomerase-like protein